jgi:hypothetical protein
LDGGRICQKLVTILNEIAFSACNDARSFYLCT